MSGREEDCMPEVAIVTESPESPAFLPFFYFFSRGGFVLRCYGSLSFLLVASSTVFPSASLAMSICHVHLNHAGDSPMPRAVVRAVVEHTELEAQVGGYRAAEIAADRLDQVYVSLSRLIGADDRNPRDEIALVESATVAWTRAFYSMMETKEKELLRTSSSRELVILVSEVEYAANVVAAVRFARDHSIINGRLKWKVLRMPSSVAGGRKTGQVDLQSFKSMLDGEFPLVESSSSTTDVTYLDPTSIAIVCLTHIPTNSGVVNPAIEIGELIRGYNIRHAAPDGELPLLYLLDACQSVGQMDLDVEKLKCHGLCATGRKYLRGPRGTGFLFVRYEIANVLEPSHIDHAAAPVKQVISNEDSLVGLDGEQQYQRGARRFEFWESNIATRLGLGLAVDHALSIGMVTIERQCRQRGRRLIEELNAVDGVEIHHANSSDCGIVTFVMAGVDALEVKRRMIEGFPIGDKLHCFYVSTCPGTSTPLDGVEGNIVRASCSYFNTDLELRHFYECLKLIADESRD